jgi:hypothetical protein
VLVPQILDHPSLLSPNPIGPPGKWFVTLIGGKERAWATVGAAPPAGDGGHLPEADRLPSLGRIPLKSSLSPERLFSTNSLLSRHRSHGGATMRRTARVFFFLSSPSPRLFFLPPSPSSIVLELAPFPTPRAMIVAFPCNG